MRYRSHVIRVCWLAAAAFWLSTVACAQTLVFDDPLTDGTTIGIRDNGQGVFVMDEGWRVDSYSDNIRYTPATPIEDGSVEFDVKGLISSDDLNPDGQLMSMYDASWGNPRFVYAPDLRLNPWKMVWHRYGDDGQQYHEDQFKIILKTYDWVQAENYSTIGAHPWNGSVTYHMKVRWRDGVARFYLNGNETDRWPWFYHGVYRPGTHDIRIGTNTRNNAIINAIYSNVKIYDYATVPIAPYINNPTNGGISKDLTPIVDWTGERHDKYEVHITTSTSPTTGIVWDSGEVTTTLSYATTGSLSDSTTYYPHVRLHNDKGWGDWSSPSQFQTNTAGTVTVPRFGEYEIALTTTNSYSNPYLSVTLSATFTGPTKTITVNGFWDGGKLYKFRMMPTETGTWTWTTSSNDAQLNGQSGSFLCESSTNKGYMRVSSVYPYTFEWADGTPFYLMGDTTWHMWYNIRFSDGSFQSLIDARAAQHFNYMHGVMFDWPHNEGGGICTDQRESRQHAGRGAWDPNTMNPGYFQWVDEKIDYMNFKGMAASLFFSWGNEGYQEFDYNEYVRYAKYLVARYASKNVVWIIVGEYEEAGEPNSRWIDYMNTVYNNDPYHHPISMHTVNDTDPFGSTTSHSFVSQQRNGTPDELRQHIADSRVYNKPVVNLEYGYEGDPSHYPSNQFPDDVRKDHYAITLAGGYGVYANNVPTYSTYHVTWDFVLTATDTPGATYMKILYEFFSQTNFHRLSPSQGLVNNGICASWVNNEYIVQLLSGGSVNINLSAASGSFYVDWFNPRSGVRTESGTTTGGGSRQFTAPDGNDWLLHIHKHVITPPQGSVTNFVAAPGNTQVSLSWTNPTDPDFDGTMIRYKTTGYPADETDGTLLIDKANSPGSENSYIHTGATNGTTYYYAAFAHNAVPEYAWPAYASAMPFFDTTLNVKPASAITIDGSPDDWNLAEFVTKVRGGEAVGGDIAIVGFDGGTLYYAGRYTGNVLPTDAADHTAKVYSRADATYQYFLVRCDDSDIWYSNPVGSNWANDCVEFYIDPSHNGGSSPMSDSTSDVQLVIDADNQVNVYVCTPGYAAQVLAGVTSAVVRDGTGWWLEARILKSALDPDLPSNGTFGLDFKFLDNDNNGDTSESTSYTWADDTVSAGFPSKIPDKWGDAALPEETDPPGPVTSFTATPGDQQNSLSWTNPSDADFAGTLIRYRTDTYPTDPSDGTLLVDRATSPGAGDNYVHSGLTNGTTYYYSAFAHDSVPNYATAANASGTPADAGPPDPVTNFTATPSSGQVSLSWTNPSSPDFTGTLIRYQTTGYPTGPTDGTLLVDKSNTPGSNDNHLHNGLTNGITYYYSAFAHDSVPNYAAAANANATPADIVCFSDDFSYPNGNLNGKGGWSGNATSQIQVVDETVKVNGGATLYEAEHSVACSGDASGVIWARVKGRAGVGDSTMWSVWIDDPGGNNLARWYGTGTSARGRIGGTVSVTTAQTLTGGWDVLDVRIYTATNQSAFYFNGSHIGTLDHTSTGGGDTVGNMIIARINNSEAAGDYMYLDDLHLGEPDTTPPGPVTNFSAQSGDGQVSLSWTNPVEDDFAGIKVLYKTTSYPTSPTDGTVIYDGAGTTHVHSGLANGTRYYYSAFAYDEFLNYSTAVSVSTTPAAETTIPGAKALADGEVRSLKNKIVSAIFSGYFYIQEPDAPHGLRVIITESVSVGWEVDVVGVMGGSGAERFIDCTGNQIITTAP